MNTQASNRTLPTTHDRYPENGPLGWASIILSAAALAFGLLWLLIPAAGPFAAGNTPLEQLLGTGQDASIAAAALLAVAGALSLTAGLLPATRPDWLGRTLPPLTAVAAALVAFGLIGFDGIVIAGYTLALSLPLGLLALILLLARRRPLLALAVSLPALGVLVLALTGHFPLGELYAKFATTVLEEPVRYATALGLIAFAGLGMVRGVSASAVAFGGLGASVRRHRKTLSVLAALCPLPYVLARISWLTPWPLFGGDKQKFADDPSMFATGLMLGAAMLLGAVLTIGLVRPWGSRFPHWVPGIGGQPVPARLAVIPALTVAVLFTAGGAEELVLIAAGQLHWASALVLPFWAWGPLLALATWGYARYRAAEG
ncbi:hypothetical protein [Glutamicibacter sp. PS]|uniref:hypothetical protein n=1 Tax=Glutamicibacter sp. PS TaxID=3075634 RepID=UPI00284749EA|nr:hypothetical protein [Glutamicibacter sp. PS]MDR4534388.1 hypothetical protein [Glutamicibacter sp. PS]